jgi:hypothetical protein
MKTQLFQQAGKNVGRALARRGWRLSLGLLLVTTLVVYAERQSAPVLVGAGVNTAAQTDPAAQGVLNYIRVHESLSAHALPLEPALQAVADYLRVHQAVSEQPLASDTAAARGVVDYLRAHSTVAMPAPVDAAATQGVLNYIRVHEAIPDSVILELYRAHADRVD